MANMIDSFLHPEDAYKEAQEAANKGWGEAQGYQKPYWQHGLDQYGRLSGAQDKLMDPAALQSEWAKGYETSPYAQQLLAQNKTQGMDAASSMGLMGSSAAIGNIQQGAGQIQAKDRQQYMDDLMRKYMTGIGIGQNMYGIGAQAGANLGGQAQQHGNDMAGLAYGREAAPGALLGQIAGAGLNYAAGGLPGLATGGKSLYGNFNSGKPSYMQ